MASIFRSHLGRIVRAPIYWLAILYVLIGLAYAVVTPVLEKPDEDGHYGYILYLRQHRALPPLSFSEGFPSEYKQPPLYYVVASILTSWLPDIADPDRLLVTNPYMDLSVPGVRNDNRNVFLHPPHMTPLILGSRLVSLLFGLGTMIACYFLALALFPKNTVVAIAAAAVVGFHPKFLYMSTAVNNDAAIAFWGALIVAFLMYRLNKGPFPYFAVLLGALLGLASITKVSGLIFVPLAGLALLSIHRGFSRAFFRDGVVIVAVALLAGGWWYARNALLYNDPLSIDTHISDEAALRPFWERIGHDLSSIERTFWANPSRTFVSPIWLDRILIWWGRTSLVFLMAGLLFNYRSVGTRKSALLLLLIWPLTLFVLLILYWTQRSGWAYGRLMLPAIAPIAVLFVLGWVVVSPRRWRTPVVMLSAGIVVIAGLLTPFVSISPLYHPWREWSEEQLEHAAGTIYVDPETGSQIAQLVDYRLSKPFALPGAYVPVELCWKPLAQTEVPYAVFVHLLDMSQIKLHGAPGIWGSRRTYPGLGNLSTDRWMPDQPFCDTVYTQVSPQAPTPLGAEIEVGFIDPETEKRLQATSEGGEVLELSTIKGVSILSPAALPKAEQPASYVLDGAIALSHTGLARELDSSITLTLTWQSLRPVTYDATTFVHLRGEDGTLLAQADRQPLDGRFPTSYWVSGQVVTDVLSLSLAPDTVDAVWQEQELDPLVLNVGMYIWPSLERLPVTDASGAALPENVIAIDVSPLSPAKQTTEP
jgi:4-amino-4-deoxy-L-arabinose transferase-like glycosyltransferase